MNIYIHTYIHSHPGVDRIWKFQKIRTKKLYLPENPIFYLLQDDDIRIYIYIYVYILYDIYIYDIYICIIIYIYMYMYIHVAKSHQ
jgi:hypothetical protein